MDKAVFELNDKLKYPSDVESKLDSILSKYRSFNEESVERNHFIYHNEIEGIKDTILRLRKAKELISEIKKSKSEIFSILESNEYSFSEFQEIQEIAIAHQNFEKTKYFVDMIKEPELNFEDMSLVECAKSVYLQEEFACEAKSYKSDLTPEEARLIDLKLNQIKKTSLNFTSTLLQIIENYVENTKEFNNIENIIETEAERDDIINKVKQGLKSEDPVLKQFYFEYPRYIYSEPKNLKFKIINVLKSAISNKFERLRGERDFLLKLEFICNDLRILNDKHFSFFNFMEFLKYYHHYFKEFIDEKLQNILPEEILGIVELKSLYYKTIESEFGVVPEAIGPKLIENENALLQKFTELACEKLKEWIDNISEIEIEKFISRDADMNRDEQGKLVSSGFINLLQIIKAQLEPIAYNRKIFIFLTGVIKEKCKFFQEKIKVSMQSELKRVLNGQGLAGFEDYCIVFGNSGLRLAQYISSLPFFQSDEVRELQSIFLQILQVSQEVLSDFIIKTSKPALEALLTDKWIKENKRRIFLITLEDFLTDYSKAMAVHAFTRFISTLCTKIYRQYVIRLKSKEIIIDRSVSENIKKDINHLSQLFQKFIDESKFKEFLSPILKLCPLIESVSADLFLIELKSLMITDKTLEKSLIENIISKKKGMNEIEKETVYSKLSELFKISDSKKNTLLQKLMSK